MHKVSLITQMLVLVVPTTVALAIVPPRYGHTIPDHLKVQMQKIRKEYGEGFWARRMAERRRLQEKVSLGLLSASVLTMDTVFTPMLMGRYSDSTPRYSRVDFQALLFEGPNPTGTVTELYWEMSYGQMFFTGEALGWFDTPGAHDYYVHDGLRTDDPLPAHRDRGLNGGGQKFVLDLFISADETVDFSKFVDRAKGNPDGYWHVTQIGIVHTGGDGAAGANNIWSHRRSVRGLVLGTADVDPKYLPNIPPEKRTPEGYYITNDTFQGLPVVFDGDYAIQPEMSGSGNTGGQLIEIGVFAHEYGHIFGLPDLYDNDGSSEGIGGWCLMAAGSYGGDQRSAESPTHMSAWCKEFLGWVTPVVVGPNLLGTLIPPAEREPVVYKLWRNGIPGMQYFLVENRQRIGLFDKSLLNSGVLVFHVDNTRDNNRDENHYWVDLEQSDGNRDLNNGRNRGDAGDPFPGSGGSNNPNFTFDAYTTPNSRDYFGNITGVAVRNIRSSDTLMIADLLVDDLENVSPRFSDLAMSANILDSAYAQGVVWADFNKDGWLDVYVGRSKDNALYQSNGDGTFTDVAAQAGVADPNATRGAAAADYDNDGDIDLYITTLNIVPLGKKNQLYRNNGDGTFTIVEGAGVDVAERGQAASWADFNGDGFVDLCVVNSGGPLHLYKNNGDGTFTDVASGAGVSFSGKAQTATWADYDNDGDLDIYLVAESNIANRLYRNNGDGSFTDVAASAGVADTRNGRGAAWGDYDNDGDLDLYVANDGQPNLLFKNNGDGTFTDVAVGAGVADGGQSQGVVWVDYDNDYDLDIYVSRVGANRLYRNQGSDVFTEVAARLGVADNRMARGVAFADYDRDGYLDLFVANTDMYNGLYRNLNTGNNWLVVELRGQSGNYSSIGARAIVVAGGKRQMREVSGGSSLMSQNALELLFGLGATTTVDSLIMRWPNGVEHVFTNVPANQRLTVGEITTGFDEIAGVIPNTHALYQNYPNPFNPTTLIAFDLPIGGRISLKLYNLLGQEVLTVIDGVYEAGSYRVEADLSSLATGVYLYRLESGSFRSTRKMVLLK